MAALPAPTAAAAAATATATAIFAGPRFVHTQGAAVEVTAVQRLNGFAGVAIRHFNKAEAARAAGVAIRGERARQDLTV